MAKDRNFYFRVKPADEALMFDRVDVEAEGLYSKMRRDAFRAALRGFLVEFNCTPASFEDMADGYRMTNGRFKARLSELHARQIIQTAEEYGASLRTLKSAWASKKVAAYAELLKKLNGKPADVFVIPALVDEVLESIVGSGTGSEGWEQGEDGKKRRKKKEGTPLGTPLGGTESPGQAEPLLPKSQSQSESESAEPNSSSFPERERQAATAARTREAIAGEPFERWLRMQVREIRGSASLMAMAIAEPDAYADEVRTLTGYSPEELAELTGDDGILPFNADAAHPRSSAYVIRFREEKPRNLDQKLLPFRSEIG